MNSLYFSYISETCNPDFIDKEGFGCQRYADSKWCSNNGGEGEGWDASWGSLERFAVNGQTAAVCPQCGCADSAI